MMTDDTTKTVTYTIHIKGFIALSTRMVVSATINDDPELRYLYLSNIDHAAKQMAATDAMSLGEVADFWNAALRQQEEAARSPWDFSMSGTFTMSPEVAEAWAEQSRQFLEHLERQFADVEGQGNS
jgi:hypothetical protein